MDFLRPTPIDADLELRTQITEIKERKVVMSTTAEGNHMARQITNAMTRFVNENVARAIKRKAVRSLPSVRRWQAKQRSGRRAQKLA